MSVTVRCANVLPGGDYSLILPMHRPEDLRRGEFSGLAADILSRAAEIAAENPPELPGAGTIASAIVPIGGRLRFATVFKHDPDNGDYEAIGATLAKRLQGAGRVVAISLPDESMPTEHVVDLCYGLIAGAWRFDRYRGSRKQAATIAEIIVVGARPELEASWKRRAARLEGALFARDLVSEPPNILTPLAFASRVTDLLEKLGVEIESLGETELRRLGMRALLGVGAGSSNPSCIVQMRWRGAPDLESPPLVFVGKGVTFDSGGITLKPGERMDRMKCDMGGAAAVAGTIAALAARRAPINVVGVCPMVENMPDGAAQRPGDIVRTLTGKTVEIISTDAEGRLILADAMAWAQGRFRPDRIITVATLTGAVSTALGATFGGLFTPQDRLAEQLLAAGETAKETLWRLPLHPAYRRLIASKVADLKNLGPAGAGASTAATFLEEFVEPGVEWAHLDIAGVVIAEEPGRLWTHGATGFGVALLDAFAELLEPAGSAAARTSG